jgi:fucose 4-O-acetylase-like acetyltransferase
MTSDDTHIGDATSRLHSISELAILKIIALILLIFFHSELAVAYPKIMNPIQWYLLSIFFFTGGYLAYSSFHSRGKSLRCFFKSKIQTLYVPFVIAVLFYLVLEASMGAKVGPLQVVSQVSMLNVFADLNAAYNWSTLWFIPFLLLFMAITCVLEKYLKSTKKQLLVISSVLIGTSLLWVYNSPLRFDSLFSQYLLVFVFGFYISKLNLYEKLMTYKTAFFAIPTAIFFSFDLLSLFNYSTTFDALQAQFYFNCRSIMLTLSLVLLTLLILRKIKIPIHGLGKQMVDRSAFIYLSEPFISFVILNYVFGQMKCFAINDIMFYIYQASRIVILLVIVPLGFMVWDYRNKYHVWTGFLKKKYM